MIEVPAILPNEEIIRLVKIYKKSGDIEARNKVVLNNVKLVYSIASKYANLPQANGYTFDDFVSEGIIGLTEAIDKFDLSRDVSFTTYAYWWIKKRVHGSVTLGTLNIPQHRIVLYRKYEKMAREAFAHGETPDLPEIAKKLKVSERILVDTINGSTSMSLTEEMDSSSQNTDTRRLIKYVKPFGENVVNAEDEILNRLDFERMWTKAKKALHAPQIKVIEKRFGLTGEGPKTLQEVSEEMHVSREYVRVLQNKALKKIKAIIQNQNDYNKNS